MTDDEPRYSAQEPQHQPNWGSAYPRPDASPPPGYPPPPGAGYPPGYPPPPGYPAYAQQPPKNPRATTAMVLGIVSVAGGVLCYGLPLFAAPFALFQGRRALQEIDASQGHLSGRSEAKAGFVLGIIGTVLLVLAIALVTTFVVLAFTIDDFWQRLVDEDYGNGPTYDRTSVAPSPVGG